MDDKDKKMLVELQSDGRITLKALSRKVGLSIDATKARMEKLHKKGIIANYGIAINPKKFGYDFVVDNKIRLKNINLEQRKRFIGYLKQHPLCIGLLAISGDFDFTCVLIAKDSGHFNEVMYEIRSEFKEIIDEWKANFILDLYKFEYYDMFKL